MRTSTPFLSAICLIFIFCLITVGMFVIVIPWAPDFRQSVCDFFEQETMILTFFGSGLIATGCLMWTSVYLMSPKQQLQIRMGERSVAVDEGLVKTYVDNYWEQVLPGQTVYQQVVVRKNTIEIVANLPFLPEEEQKPLLERVEKDLTLLFKDTLGYRKEFLFSVSFRNSSKSPSEEN